MKMYLAGDHAGFELKKQIAKELSDLGHEVHDFGAAEFAPEDDYPDFILPAAQAVATDARNNVKSIAVILGGSGQGEAMAANRVLGARAAVFYGPVAPKGAIDIDGELSADPYSIVRLERQHNNANMLSIGARFVTLNEAVTAIKIFIDTPFIEGERHVRRLGKF
jgi:ribose 5-phosphate isomerase B